MLVTRRQMQSIYEEDALPTLLGSSRQRQFFHKGKMHAMPKGWEAHTPGEAPPADLDEISEPPRTKAGKCAFHKGNMHGMPRGWEAHMPGGTKNELSDLDELSDGRRTNDDKWRVLEEFSSSKWRRFDEKKQRGAKPQPSAAEHRLGASWSKLQDSNERPSTSWFKLQDDNDRPSTTWFKLQESNEIPHGAACEETQPKVEALPHKQRAKLIGCHPLAKTGMSHMRHEWPISVAKAEKEFMSAVIRNDVKRAEELLSEHGPSLMSSFGSLSILNIARNNLGSNYALSNKMCELLIAQGEVPISKHGCDIKKGGLVTHDAKEELGKTFKEGRNQDCCEKDSRKLNANENKAAARRSASVPHIWANTSYPVSVPKRGVSNTRTRQKPIYQSDA
eukprot:gnl/MRDRNA2_/MRDRNA2_60248_c0_seq1.p1 gnl/MRDRNA2_/MRDRNA2_60248_c0~~gnl/MRDRNA2_/MRDRNA2_60248_c0_seq1.p1  ORF type:complete len:391 (+),score=69.48 gnl/MRDRNA2_/MRDRNA2_60248_c0_seq1:71-1243(+)